MGNKVISLVKDDGPVTYIDLLNAHIARLTDDEKNRRIDSLMICGDSIDDGIMYTILEGRTALEIIGLLEAVKNLFTLASILE